MSLETPGTGSGGRVIQQQLLTNAIDGYNVKLNPYNAKGDGVTGDFGAIQGAINDAGVGGRIIFPPGIYNLAGNQLVWKDFQEVVGRWAFGVGAAPAAPGDGKVQLVWGPTLGGAAANVCGKNMTWEKVCFMGVASGVTTGSAVQSGDAVNSNHSRFRLCQFVNFGRGLTNTNGFYTSLEICEFNRCAIGAFCDDCFNISFHDCYFRPDPVTLGVAAEFVNGVAQARFFGGSIESFGPSGGIILANSSSCLDLFGVYFESSSVGSLGFGVDNRANGNTITAIGNLVYLSEISRWINCSGLDATTLLAKGNHFKGNASTNPAPVAYQLPANATGGLVELGPDNFENVIPAIPGALYTSSVNGTSPWLIMNAPRILGTTLSAVLTMARPIWLMPATVAPALTLGGEVAAADGATWNPLGRIGGNPYPVWQDNSGSGWRALFEQNQIGADRGDANVTLTVNTDVPVQRFATNLTANRTVTLSATGARNGDRFRIVRTNTAAFTLDVGGLKTIPAGTAAFVDVVFDNNGATWRLAGYGTL